MRAQQECARMKGKPAGYPDRVGWLLETTWWACVAVATWLATLSSVTGPELLFALGAGFASGLAATAGRRALGGSWRFRASWLAWLPRLPLTIAAETFALLSRTAQGPLTGRLRSMTLPEEHGATGSGREAVVSLALSVTPGSIVADYDPVSRALTVHALVKAGPDIEKAIRR